MSGYLTHVTLTTGHSTRQYRDAVGQRAIDAVSELLDQVLQGGHPAIPGTPGYYMDGTHSGKNLLVTIHAGPWAQRVPVLTIGVSLRARSAPSLWRMLHASPSLPVASDPASPPPAPWIADRIEAGAIHHQDALTWTGDLSRCLGWAWMEYAR